MMRPLTIILIISLFNLMTSACSKKTPSHESALGAASLPHAQPSSPPASVAEDTHRDDPQHEEWPRTLKLDEKLVQSAGIQVAAVRYELLAATVDLSGEIAPEPDHLAHVVARANGRIVEVHFQEGDHVKKGTLLVVLESTELAQARATFASVQARASRSRVLVKRLQVLSKDGFASGQELAAAEAELATAAAEEVAAKQKIVGLGQEIASSGSHPSQVLIRSPLNGFVLARDAVSGQVVEATHRLASIADLMTVHFVARVMEKNLAQVQVGAKAEVRLNAYPEEVFQGEVQTMGKQLDPAARTVVARVRVKNKQDLLKIGLFGMARISVPHQTDHKRRLVVSQSAVTRLADQDVVFVKHPDGDFEAHPVTLGPSSGGRVEILSGLREGESVVTEGVFTLKSIALKSTFGEEE